jgi:hypothetical protein
LLTYLLISFRITVTDLLSSGFSKPSFQILNGRQNQTCHVAQSFADSQPQHTRSTIVADKALNQPGGNNHSALSGTIVKRLLEHTI